MPYIFLRNIVESVLANYTCPDCSSHTSAEHIIITGMSSRWLDLQINCGICGTHSHLAAEVNTMASELLASEQGKQFFSEFIKNGGTLGATIANKVNPDTTGINAADIAKIGEDIENARSIEDLMK